MGTKTIGISDDAYERLSAVKQEGESFSDVIRRRTGAHMLRRLAGTMDKQTGQKYHEAIERGRNRTIPDAQSVCDVSLIGRVTVDPDVLAGKPVIRGTRIPVHLILEMLSAGVTKEDILREYPQLSAEDVTAAIRWID